MSRLIFQFSIIPLLFLILSNCVQPHPKESTQPDAIEKEMPSYARFLKGIKICLDPGHGGQGHIPGYKRGPTGLREAEINLKVAFYLKELLEQVEVNVVMTRVDDSYVSLAQRSQIANDNQVDFFISIHHNGLDDNPETNYSSTWYHGDADESRASLDLARYVHQGVTDALRLPNTPATGLYSDKLIVASGFGVLRLTECPAIVCEASFYTNPEEETRLKDDNYLKREAYGYFRGIARYVEAGFPKGVLITPEHESIIQSETPTIKIQVMDGIHERGAWILKRQQVFTNTIQVKIDNVIVPFQYDRDTDVITVDNLKPLSNGIHYIQTDLVNYYGNHNLPKPQQFKVAPPATELQLKAWTETLPYDGKSYVGITVTALDADGLPIADDEQITAKTSNGTLKNTENLSINGTSQFYLNAPKKQGSATVVASYGQTNSSIKIRFANIAKAIIQGQITDSDANTPIDNVELHVDPEITVITDVNGHYFIRIDPALITQSETILSISKPGYYPDKHKITIERNKATIVNTELYAIADGAFSKTVLVLDTETDTPKSRELITTLKEVLELAGAKVYNIHTAGQKLDTKTRIQTVNKIKDEGYYLQINHTPKRKGKSPVVAKHNRGNQGTETFQKRILEQFNANLFETPIVTVQDRETPIIQQTNKLAMTLEIRSLDIPDATVMKEATTIFVGAWLYLKEETEIDEEKLKRFMQYFNQKRGE
ncbi:hypothetical protein F4212_03055 [Candidatus Poribacteria bacterium]|nr:hypothetical protein [Candidatus Poribacteria bacterium]